MSKLVYFIVPISLLLGSITLLNSRSLSDHTDLLTISGHLTVMSAEPPADLNFCDQRVPQENFDVKERIDKELQRNVYYHSSTVLLLKRMGRYRDIFLQILKENEVPEDFLYLSVAESALSNAISPVGAKGFWQFMRPTGKHYGLEISETVDERFHPEKATQAAASYLKDLHKQFGDWSLVAASYNMGPSGVKRAMRNQEVDSYFDLHLNKETSAYLFRILAFKTIMEQPYQYGFHVNNPYKPVPYYAVTVSENIPNLAAFARKNGSTYRMLKLMNPWLVASSLTVKDGKTYEIRFPLANDLHASEMAVDDQAPEKEDKIEEIQPDTTTGPALIETHNSIPDSIPLLSTDKEGK